MTDRTLTDDDARAVIVGCIETIAPDVGDETADLAGDVDFWEELGLDSMDQLNVMVAIHERIGVEVPERDYGQLRTLDAFAAYLVAAAGVGSSESGS